MKELTTKLMEDRVWMRLLSYWLVVLAVWWILIFFYFWISDPGYEKYQELVYEIFEGFKDQDVIEWSGDLLGFITPLLISATFCAVLLTTTRLPVWRLCWINDVASRMRSAIFRDADYGHELTQKKNQIFLSEFNFNWMAIWFIVIPMVVNFVAHLPSTFEKQTQKYQYVEGGKTLTQIKFEKSSYLAGWVGSLCLAFFLIPVSRHSILLVAMGWSPVDALRFHVWAGYTAFFFIAIHGLLLVIVWFGYDTQHRVYEQFIPPSNCWTEGYTKGSYCKKQIYNLTGLIAFIFYTALWVTSLNWFRRRSYRVFYIFHVVNGTLALLTSVWHFEFIALYLTPSLLYYLASTAPTLIQALASRFRGGVKITKVIQLRNAGGCMEVHVSTVPQARAMLEHECTMFVKVCVPKISLVWHPFTVYAHGKDKNTVRLLFRPIGPFTKEWANSLIAPERPVTLIDGFYRGPDRCSQALQHDHVTIVAGGVAITPFLSMIPAVLGAVNSNNRMSTTRALTICWVCRESGLIDYIVPRYLHQFMDMAREIPEFSFRIMIFNTRAKSILKHDDTESMDMSETSEEIVETPVTGDHKSHSMELGHMMPGRFSTVKENIPLALTFALPVWMGFYIVMSTYEDDNVSVKSGFRGALIAMGVILLMFAFAFIFEGIHFSFGRLWPASRADDFVIVESETSKNYPSPVNSSANSTDLQVDLNSDTSDDQLKEESPEGKKDFARVCCDHFQGRPTPSLLLADSIESRSPGIFLCGPVTLMTSVSMHAKQHNSFLGLTRYCVYEEKFEM